MRLRVFTTLQNAARNMPPPQRRKYFSVRTHTRRHPTGLCCEVEQYLWLGGEGISMCFEV